MAIFQERIAIAYSLEMLSYIPFHWLVTVQPEKNTWEVLIYRMFTLLKSDSSPLKSYLPKRKRESLPTIIFQGRAVKLPGGNTSMLSLFGASLFVRIFKYSFMGI